MASDQGPPKKLDPLELIRKAGKLADADKVSDALARMDQDDKADESAGLVLLESDAPSTGTASGSLFADESFDPQDGTVQEQDLPTDTTVELQEDQLAAAIDGDGVNPSSQPSLSDPNPSSRGTIIVTPRYRPSRRPPMALLRVYDDDLTGAEEFRVRQSPFIIGRQDGDLVIGHERQMSRRHARIDRVEEGDTWRWYLGDLRSTNGTFVRVSDAWLDDGVEMLIAGELVRFNQPLGAKDASLTKVGPTSEEERVRLTGGRSPNRFRRVGLLALPAVVSRSSIRVLIRLESHNGRWRVVDLASTNHVMITVTKRAELTDGAVFQIGEQRFQLPPAVAQGSFGSSTSVDSLRGSELTRCFRKGAFTMA